MESQFTKNESSDNNSENLNPEKLDILEKIKNKFEKLDYIISAKAYGSWLYEKSAIDLDLCVVVPSDGGVVDSNTYRELYKEHKKLSEETGQDVDLIPHTKDEINDLRSTLYYPRYNPSLLSGKDIKGLLPIESIYNKEEKFEYSDLSAYILLDNRTICRRQLVRSLNESESRIFASKLLHGPGNALTYYSCKNKTDFISSPSDIVESLKHFDKIYKVDSKKIENFLLSCKANLSFVNALKLISWYESLVDLVLYNKNNYQNFCNNFDNSKENE